MNDLAVLVKSLLGESIHSLQLLGEGTDHLAYAVFYARCALLEDLSYGLRTSRPPYVEHALRHFWRTFT